MDTKRAPNRILECEFCNYVSLTCLEVYMINCPLMALMPCCLCWGYILCLAIIKAYMLEMEPPGAKMESPLVNPMISLIFAKTACSIRMKTGAISYVNMLVLAVAVNHSPAMETMSRPVESWLKNLGCPIGRGRKTLKYSASTQIY